VQDTTSRIGLARAIPAQFATVISSSDPSIGEMRTKHSREWLITSWTLATGRTLRAASPPHSLSADELISFWPTT